MSVPTVRRTRARAVPVLALALLGGCTIPLPAWLGGGGGGPPSPARPAAGAVAPLSIDDAGLLATRERRLELGLRLSSRSGETQWVSVRFQTPDGQDCVSLIVSVPNRPGAVHDLLVPLKTHGVSMTRFESRPARSGQWEYYFYIDLQGHPSQPNVAAALKDLKSLCAFYKVLGTYPAGE